MWGAKIDERAGRHDAGWVELHKSDFLKIINVSDIVFSNEDEIKALTSADNIDYDKIKKSHCRGLYL